MQKTNNEPGAASPQAVQPNLSALWRAYDLILSWPLAENEESEGENAAASAGDEQEGEKRGATKPQKTVLDPVSGNG